MIPTRWCFLALSALLLASLPAAAQSVVSTHSGVVHYFEGTVSIGGTLVQPQFGRFPEIAEGSELRTAQGRAEVLLGPGVMVRVAEDSAVKMLSTRLADTRLELETGSAILQSNDALPGNSVTLIYKDWQVRVGAKGVYRIDSDPAQLRVYDGQVEVRPAGGPPVKAKAGQTLPLSTVLVPEQTLGPPGDAFNSWAFERSEAIAADNATAAQIVDDPALYPDLANLSGLSLAGYTYFPPTIGAPYMSYSQYMSRPYYGGMPPYVVGTGYGFRYGYYGFSGRPVGSFNQGLPVRTYMPQLPVRSPILGGSSPRPVTAYPTTRPGVMGPSVGRPMPAAPAVHGGRR
jgi:hypothetical protein